MGDAPDHTPVLLAPLLARAAPVRGVWLDGTFGAGGYARGLLEAGADRVIGVDRDPSVFRMAESWAGAYGDRLCLVEGRFSDLDRLAEGPLDGVVLDLGVSSMQLDEAARGFSFQKDGPLDMRMSQQGPSAATLVNEATEAELADILFHYGEERAARRIARAIVAARAEAPIVTTAQLAEIVSRVPAAAQARAKQPGHTQLPGAAYRGQRRVRRTGGWARGGGTGAGARWVSRRCQLPFDGGPRGKAVPAGARPPPRGEPSPARGRGRGAPLHRPVEGHRARRRRTARQPARPLGPVAHGATHRRARRAGRSGGLGLPKIAFGGKR